MRGARRFYLSEDTGNGMTALSVCADGYHMASLWEVYDVSNLEYAAVPQRSVSAHAPLLDQGSGLASIYGRIRTSVAVETVIHVVE